jgi:hypothetical protein
MGEEPKPRDTFKISGHVRIYAFPADFTFEQYRNLSEDEKLQYLVDEGSNLVVNAGADQIINLMIGANTNSFTNNAVGTSATAVAAAQTALVGQINPQLTVTSRSLESTGKAHYDTFYGSGDNAGTWQETGIFTAGGVMLCRKVISSFVKTTSNTAVVAWTITLVPTP